MLYNEMFISCQAMLMDIENAILLFHSNHQIYERSNRPLDTFKGNPNVNDWLDGSLPFNSKA